MNNNTTSISEDEKNIDSNFFNLIKNDLDIAIYQNNIMQDNFFEQTEDYNLIHKNNNIIIKTDNNLIVKTNTNNNHTKNSIPLNIKKDENKSHTKKNNKLKISKKNINTLIKIDKFINKYI